MIKLKDILTEARDEYEVYHNTFSSAVQAARKWAEGKGYTIDEDDWARDITFGSGRPSKGKTLKANIDLLKNGKLQKKALHIQIYGMEKSYELNAYIN
jgi:hypothetical protein